jgi:hypothetical protein
MYAGFDGYFSARTAGCIVSTLNKSNDNIVAYNVLDEKKLRPERIIHPISKTREINHLF